MGLPGYLFSTREGYNDMIAAESAEVLGERIVGGSDTPLTVQAIQLALVALGASEIDPTASLKSLARRKLWRALEALLGPSAIQNWESHVEDIANELAQEEEDASNP